MFNNNFQFETWFCPIYAIEFHVVTTQHHMRKSFCSLPVSTVQQLSFEKGVGGMSQFIADTRGSQSGLRKYGFCSKQEEPPASTCATPTRLEAMMTLSGSSFSDSLMGFTVLHTLKSLRGSQTTSGAEGESDVNKGQGAQTGWLVIPWPGKTNWPPPCAAACLVVSPLKAALKQPFETLKLYLTSSWEKWDWSLIQLMQPGSPPF